MYEANKNLAKFCKFSKLKKGCLFKSLYLEKKTHYPISNLFLFVLLYIVEAKKGCKEKSLNILSFAADLLKAQAFALDYNVCLYPHCTGRRFCYVSKFWSK